MTIKKLIIIIVSIAMASIGLTAMGVQIPIINKELITIYSMGKAVVLESILIILMALGFDKKE